MKNTNVLRLLSLTVLFLMVVCPAMANPDRPAITQPVDTTVRVSLRGNIASYVLPQNDMGAVDDSAPTGMLYLLLGRSPGEQRQLDQYVLSLSSQGSPKYRQWLTPATFAKQFGANDQDIATITAWLQGQGFQIEKVNQAKTVIGFSGTMGAVSMAFGTEIHKFSVGGTIRYANTSDLQIPAALAPVVRGVVGLNRVVSSPSSTGSVELAVQASKANPLLTNNSNLGMGIDFTPVAGDAAVIYDTPNAALNPAYSGSTLDGTGVTIGAVETSDLSSTSLQDFANYRMNFLNNTAAQAAEYIPTIVVEGTDPGVLPTSNTLYLSEVNGAAPNAIADGELSQALAPGSKTVLYVAETVEQSLLRAVDDNTVSILINVWQDCESDLGAASNQFLDQEYEQAATQGITVVVASGNFGSGGCPTTADNTTGGFGVDGYASTPWTVSVGGTDFQVLYLAANMPQYIETDPAGNNDVVGVAPYYTTALGYIPEGAWNNATLVFGAYADNEQYGPGRTFYASGGGPSSLAVCSGTISSSGTCSGTLSGYAKPAYQSSLTENDGVRDVPDISLFAGIEGTTNDSSSAPPGASAWATCQDPSSDASVFETDCTGSNLGIVTPAGGTNAAAAAAAGIFALVEQQEGQRLGLVNPTLYRLFTVAPSAFHNITTSNNSVSCASGSPNCGSNGFLEGYNATAGYNLATGLGSLDVAKLVANWDNAGLDQTTTSLTAGTSAGSLGTGSIAVSHGTTVYFDATVNPSSATGNISVVNNSGGQDNGSLAAAPLSSGSASFSSQSLPGGTYTVLASYGGDSNDLASESNAIAVTVTPESSKLAMTLQSWDPSTGTTTNNVTSIPYGLELGLAVTPYGSAGEGEGSVPTGTVSASSGSTSFGSAPLNVATTTNGGPGTGYITIANTGLLTPGSDLISVQYSGDASYNATNSNLGFTVTKGAVTVLVVAGVPTGCTTPTSNWSVQPTCIAGANVTTDSVGAAPTGTIAITFNGSTQTLALAPTGGAGTSTGVNVAQSGADTTPIDVTAYVGTYLPTASATYGGDSNYLGGSATSTTIEDDETVVSEPSGAAFALSNSGAITVSPGAQGTNTITVTPASGFLGQVALTCTVAGGSGSDLPTCSIPSSATITNSGPQTVTLTIGTTAATSTVVEHGPMLTAGTTGGITGLLAAAGLLLFGLWISKRRIASGLFIVLLAGSLLVGISACGGTGSGSQGGGGGNQGTPAGTYTVTVTGSNPNVTYDQGWVSNPLTGSTSVTLTVN